MILHRIFVRMVSIIDDNLRSQFEITLAELDIALKELKKE